MRFTVMPYAELLHHAALGDLQDFTIGERAIFRMHENEQGEWVWLTYIQDEMNMMNGHKEFFHVQAIDGNAGTLATTWANADKSYIRQENVVIETDQHTRYWKDGKEVKFAEIQVGNKLRTKTHGRGAGKSRVAWEIFLDEASLQQFQAAQKAVHAQRMETEGLPGYVDHYADKVVQITLFREGIDFRKSLKPGATVQVAPAGMDRKPVCTATEGTITSLEGDRLTLTLATDASTPFQPTELARVWVPKAVSKE
jgi:hypothetical protein